MLTTHRLNLIIRKLLQQIPSWGPMLVFVGQLPLYIMYFENLQYEPLASLGGPNHKNKRHGSDLRSIICLDTSPITAVPEINVYIYI